MTQIGVAGSWPSAFMRTALVTGAIGLLGTAGYRYVTASVLEYSTAAWLLRIALAAFGLSAFLPRTSRALAAMKGRVPANRFSLGIGIVMLSVVAPAALLPGHATAPAHDVRASVIEEFPERSPRGACREYLRVHVADETQQICLRYWGGELRGFTARFDPGDDVDLEVIDHWLGEVVIGIHRHGA